MKKALKMVLFESLSTVSYSPAALHSNYGRIFSHFEDIQRQRMAWPWNLGLGSLKVIENGSLGALNTVGV